MRAIRMLVVGFPLLLALGCVAPAEEGSGDGVVLLPVSDDPTVTFKVWFRVGSQDDPPGREGLAWLTGRMIAEGATTNNSYPEILERLYPLASSYDVRVDREMTVLTGRTHRDNIDAYFELFSDAYLRPAFAEEDFQRVRADTLNYLTKNLRYESDEELAKAALYRFVFEGTRYAHPPQGSVSGIEALSVDDVAQFYATHFTRDNAVLALGGGYDEGLLRRLRATRDGLPEGPAPPPPAVPDPAPIDGLEFLLVSKPDADASISFGFPLDLSRGEREFYALWIANSWLGEHRNSASHLFKVIRETRGLNYGDYSYIEAFPEGGRRNVPPTHVARRRQLFEVWIRTLPDEHAHFALRAAMRELTALVEEGLSEEEFELTRSFLRKYVLHFADTTQARLGYAVDDRFYGIEPPGHLELFRTRMGEITREEVNAAIRRHLQAGNVKFAIVTGDAEGLARALSDDVASPMRYPSSMAEEVLAEDREIERFPLKTDASRIRILPVEEMFR